MLIINAEIRKNYGKSASRRLRKINQLPAVIYGNNLKPILIKINHDDIINKENKAEFYETLILIINEQKNKVRIQAIQRHPFKPKLIHIDFLLI